LPARPVRAYRSPVVTCNGTGISIPRSKSDARCMVLIPTSKLSGLCHFCERTEGLR